MCNYFVTKSKNKEKGAETQLNPSHKFIITEMDATTKKRHFDILIFRPILYIDVCLFLIIFLKA